MELKADPFLSLPRLEELMLKTDLGFFAEEMLGIEISDHHTEWSTLVAGHPRLAIEAPRDHGKSFFFSFAYAIWRSYYAWIPPILYSGFKSIPKISMGYIFSNTQDQAIKFLEIIRNELETNPKLQHLVPEKKDNWNKTEMRLSNRAVLRARGWGTSVRGAHPCWAICQPRGTLVLTRRGYKKIERLVVGDHVWTHRGRWKPITTIGVRLSEVVGYKLSGSDDYEWATPEHRFYGDDGFFVPVEKSWVKAPLLLGEEYESSLSPSMLKLLGLFLGDGSLSNTRNGKYRKHGIVIYVSRYEKEIDQIIKDAGFFPCWADGETCRRVAINSEPLYRLCRTMKAKGNSQKRVPFLFESLSEDKLKALVYGYYLSDGSFVNSRRRAGEYKFTSVSRPMLRSFQRILARLGVTSNIRVLRESKWMEICGRRHLCQRTYDLRVGWEFGGLFGFDYKPKRIIKNKRQCIEDGFIRRRVEKIVRPKGEVEVVSFTVADDHSYSGHLVCTHNCDDVLNDESIYSEITRKKQVDYFFSAVTPMIVPGGQIVVIGTPFHGEDLYQKLSENKSYVFKKYPALDAYERPLWPTRYTKEHLLSKKDEVGSTRFAREYLCEPVSDESSLFPEKILIDCYDYQYEMPNHLTPEDRKSLMVFTGVDLALSSTVGADYTVITTLGVDKFKNRWIIDIRRKKGLSMTEQLREIEDVYMNYRPLKVLIEDNGFQRVFRDELVKNTDIPVEGFTTTAHNKNSLEKGVPSLQILFENKKFVIPRKTERDRRITDFLINELKCFTWQDGKLQGLGAHDDCVMSLWIASEACSAYQFSFSFV